jgi:hypothetical protein
VAGRPRPAERDRSEADRQQRRQHHRGQQSDITTAGPAMTAS